MDLPGRQTFGVFPAARVLRTNIAQKSHYKNEKRRELSEQLQSDCHHEPEGRHKGAAILGQMSMPIGGEGTHCVIAGHRTWNAILHPFVGLEKVQPGDLVCLTNPWETLIYRVTEIEIIFPDDSEKIRLRPGWDPLPVFTCTYPNTRRVLVTA